MSKFDSKKFWASYQGKAVAIVPKCGNTSFSNLVGGVRLTLDETLAVDTRVMFVRDPLDRFTSAYSFFHMLNCDDRGKVHVPREATHNGYEHFVDFALSTENPHWKPQMQLTGGIATHLYKFSCESIRKWWPVHWPGRQPDWLNACSHLPTTDYRMNDLLEYYAEDLLAYERAA